MGKIPARLKKYTFISLLVWTAILAGSAIWNSRLYYNNAIENARIDANSSYTKDLLYRKWVSIQGGVYVFPTDSTPPNPYLTHILNRDLVTTTGKKLTLINPAYMTRQVHDLGKKSYRTQGHITSLLPLNPGNKPDEWEIAGLRAFEQGQKEVVKVTEENGHKYLRFMRPMVTEKGCLKCHAHQGYKLGDIRGGIAIKVPLDTYLKPASVNISQMIILHMIILAVGFLSIGTGTHFIGKSMAERDRKAEELRDNQRRLEAHIERIEKFNRIAVAREKRIGELKQQINSILKENNQKEIYNTPSEEIIELSENRIAEDITPAKVIYKPEDLFDREQMQKMLEDFGKAFGVATAIVDHEGSLFAASNFNTICSAFHRVNSRMSHRCVESDTVLAGQMNVGEKFTVYKCKNGLIDAAAPIIVDNQHICNFFIGQFFIEKPDRNYFIQQAREFGLNETEYLEALDRVPYMSSEQLKPILHFLAGSAEIIGRMALDNIKSRQAEKVLEKQTAELKDTVKMLQDQRLAAINLAEDANEARIAAETAQESLRTSQEQLKNSLREKETLIRELYHRTKNNMQIIISMMNLEASMSDNEELNSVLNETSNRIVTMALVHQKLYQAQDLSSINFREYITELTGMLSSIYNVNNGKIKMDLDLEDQFLLIDYAIPCGLIINEIISNTFKYAFPGSRQGSLKIRMSRDQNRRILLQFKDDGVGLPDDFDINNTNTLGMQLLTSLVNHQLNGELKIKNENGVSINISFNDDQYKERV